jgi:predicted dehydrogenase/threonine dehydrogenase-like Zn-dependent dehydrogenase
LKQVVQHIGTRKLALEEVPEPRCKSGGVLVRNAFSLISAGTERMVIDFANKSLVGKAQERPDLVKKVLEKVAKEGLAATIQTVRAGLDRAIPLGYSCAGYVEEVGRGAGEFSVGQRVACAGMGYASHADVIFAPKNLTVAVPENVTLEDASYVTVGAIALHGVRTADARFGEAVVVIGLGLLGQLAVQILRAQGCRVLGIDLDPAKVSLALEMGAEAAVLRSDDVAAAVASFTGGIGADGVVIAAAADSNDPIELAGEIARDRARVTVVGAVGMNIPRALYYNKELELRISRSYGPGRYDSSYEEDGHDYPIGYVRWSERRNMQEFLRLVGTGQVTPVRLTTHRYALENAPEAYDIVTGKQKEHFAGVVLTYPETRVSPPVRTVRLASRSARSCRTGVGFIGAGNFATTVLLPRFQKRSDLDLVGLATATGINSKLTGDRFGFRYATTDHAQLLADADVQAVVIATRHDSHPRFVVEALRAGKDVFVEKPLAIDEAGLAEVLAVYEETGGVLSVGFNRRFSPLVQKARAAFDDRSPVAITYRINAGSIPPSTWVHDPEEGGGRIIGEVCHFVDLVQYLARDAVTEAFAYGMGGSEGAMNDTVTIALRMAGGSVANICYYAVGDRAFPKERIEVFGGSKVAVINDFRELEITRNGKRERDRKLAQSKGFDEEIEAFLQASRGETGLPIEINSLVATTRATFAIEQSLATGLPVAVSTGV